MLTKKFNLLVVFCVLFLGILFFWIFNFNSQLGSSNPTVEPIADNRKADQIDQEKLEVVTNISNPIDLSGKNLEKLPSYVLARTDLEELNISNNKLTGALPSEIGKLKNLKILNASNNLMTGVPAEIGHLPDLEVLDLSNNELTGLPYELANLKKLKILNLSGNDYSKQDLEIIRKGLTADVQIIL